VNVFVCAGSWLPPELQAYVYNKGKDSPYLFYCLNNTKGWSENLVRMHGSRMQHQVSLVNALRMHGFRMQHQVNCIASVCSTKSLSVRHQRVSNKDSP
jgi:hypothetical protein